MSRREAGAASTRPRPPIELFLHLKAIRGLRTAHLILPAIVLPDLRRIAWAPAVAGALFLFILLRGLLFLVVFFGVQDIPR